MSLTASNNFPQRPLRLCDKQTVVRQNSRTKAEWFTHVFLCISFEQQQLRFNRKREGERERERERGRDRGGKEGEREGERARECMILRSKSDCECKYKCNIPHTTVNITALLTSQLAQAVGRELISDTLISLRVCVWTVTHYPYRTRAHTPLIDR